MEAPQDEKAAYRRALRRYRAGFDAALALGLSRRIEAHVVGSEAFRQAAAVAFYVAVANEVATDGLLKWASEAGKRVFLPVVVEREMGFVPFFPGDVLERGAFGIPEPVHRREMLRGMALQSLDLIFTPLVAFDCWGGRLGYGGGFYDRAMAPVRTGGALVPREGPCDSPGRLPGAGGGSPARSRVPRLVGLAYGFQEIPPFTQASYDIPLDYVATEKGFFKIGRPGLVADRAM